MENDSLAEPGDGGSFDFFLALFCFFAIGGGLAFFAARKQSRCPNCGKHQLQRSGSRLVSRINGVKTEDITYTWGGGGGGPFIGGFGGGRGFGGGGGFSGGSFGGGMGGGGGAGSRF